MKIASLQGNESHFTNLKHELSDHVASDALLCTIVMQYYDKFLSSSTVTDWQASSDKFL